MTKMNLSRSRDVTDLIGELGSIARIVNSGKDPQDILDRIAYSVCHQSSWSSSSIMAVDHKRNESVQVASFYPAEHPLPRSWQLARSPTLMVLKTGQPLVINDAMNDKTYIDYWNAAQARRYRTIVLLPMNVADEMGRPMILSLHASQKLSLSAADMAYLSAVADLVGIAVDKGQRLRIERQANERLANLLSLHRSLFDQALGGSSLESVVEVGRKFLQVPFIVADLTTGRALCSGVPAGVPGSEAGLAESLQVAKWPMVVQLFRDLDTTKFVDAALSPMIDASRHLSPKAIVESVSVRRQTVGGIVVFPDDAQSKELLASAIGLIWMYLCIVLLRNHILLQSESDAWSELISPLLLGHISEQAAFAGRAGERGLRLDQPHRLLAVSVADDQAGTTAVHWALTRIARSLKPHCIHGILDNCFVFVLPSGEQVSNTVKSIGVRAMEEIRRTTGKKPIVVESEPCQALSDYSVSWRRIRRIIGWAKEARLDGVVTASDTGPISLLADALEYKPTRDFAASVLMPIISYDAKHTTPLMPTLVALLKSGGRLQQAAAELKIHVTTVRYRKDRISNLLNIDLDNPEDRFRFDLALRLSRLVDFNLQAAPEMSVKPRG